MQLKITRRLFKLDNISRELLRKKVQKVGDRQLHKCCNLMNYKQKWEGLVIQTVVGFEMKFSGKLVSPLMFHSV